MDGDGEGCDGDDVRSVLRQERQELCEILTCQTPKVMATLCNLMSVGARQWMEARLLPEEEEGMGLSLLKKRALEMLEYFDTAGPSLCQQFLQTVCMICENMPMRLENRLMSLAGDWTDCTGSNNHTKHEEAPVSLTETEPDVKRPRKDHWECYKAAVRELLLRRWARAREGLVREVQLDEVWVCRRHRNHIRSRDRPDRTPLPRDKGYRTPDTGDELEEDRMTVESFLQSPAERISVLLGHAGSGKTLLMSRLGQDWAKGLGPIPPSFLLLLLEFRQLNLLSSQVSLSQLLFCCGLPPPESDDQRAAVLDCVLANPEQCCLVLDGYDEFHSRIGPLQKQPTDNLDLLDPHAPLPVSQLVSGLLSRRLLPGCTLLVTCRPRDLGDLDAAAERVAELTGFDHRDIREYALSYYQVKGFDEAFRERAVQLLLSDRHLLSMTTLPALCHACCLCLEHLLVGSGGAGGDPSSIQLPTTRTQLYLTILGSYLSQSPGGAGAGNRSPPHSKASSLSGVGRYRVQLQDLSRLALQGLEESRVMFLDHQIPAELCQFSTQIGLLTQEEVRLEDGALGHAYCFPHLTIQEFLSALRIMSSREIPDTQLRKMFNLKSRWTTKTDRKTVFTDSLHLYLCGLTAAACTPALVLLARETGPGPEAQAKARVKKRQALVLKLLRSLAGNTSLTGPKLIELCHCALETQDPALAREVVGSHSTLELRNIWLSSGDMEALAFVVSSAGVGVGLDIGACSMELGCLDVLPRCRYISCLTLRSRKYGDGFAAKLSTALPSLTTLRKLEFTGANLTVEGATKLVEALQKCPLLAELNLSDNNLLDRGLREVADALPRLPSLTCVRLGRNGCSLDGVFFLLQKITTSCYNIEEVHIDETKDIQVTFTQSSEMNGRNKPGPTLRLLGQTWSREQMKRLCELLSAGAALTALDLSRGKMELATLKTLTDCLPRLTISQYIHLNGSSVTVGGLVLLTGLLSACPTVVEIHIRLQSPGSVVVLFGAGEESGDKAYCPNRKLCLSGCGLKPAHVERVSSTLKSCAGLTMLDVSCNHLGAAGLKRLLELLPKLNAIQEIDVSNNNLGTPGVVLLAEALCSHRGLAEVTISKDGNQQVLLKFHPAKSGELRGLTNSAPKTFRVTDSTIMHADITRLCVKLIPCSAPLHLDLSGSFLREETIEQLVHMLPKMSRLRRLSVSHTQMSPDGALLLVSCLIESKHVSTVELRHKGESFVEFDQQKEEHAFCRLTKYPLNRKQTLKLCEILEQCPWLSDLDLSSSLLGDEGLTVLVDSLPRLKISSSVILHDNNLSQQGALYLVKSLSTCGRAATVEVSVGAEQTSMIRFSQEDRLPQQTLRLFNISLHTGDQPSLLQHLADLSLLHTLELCNSGLTGEIVGELVQQLTPGITKLCVSIEETWISGEAALGLVCSCLELNHYIHTIRVQKTTLHITLETFTVLPQISVTSSETTCPLSAAKISLVDCAVEGRHLVDMQTVILRCTSLQELDLSHNRLGKEGAEFLCSVLPSLNQLHTLILESKESSEEVVGPLAQAILQTPSLRSLNLSGHVISDEAAASLSRTFQNRTGFTSLDLSLVSARSAAGLVELLRGLAHCVGLEVLSLDSVPLDGDSLVCLAWGLGNMTSLRSLNLNKVTMAMGSGEGAALAVLKAMEGLRHIEDIQLQGWRLGDKPVHQLTKLLPSWTKLRTVSLSENSLSDQSGDRLLQALKGCIHLEELHLPINHLGLLSADRLSQVLPSFPRLSTLDLSQNSLGPDGPVSLSKGLRHMASLTKLHLTSIGSSELSGLAASLKHCGELEDVSLSWNDCGDCVAVELAKVLPLCRRLLRLDLESNSISSRGADSLVRSLQTCPSLPLTIRLWKNKISIAEAQRLTERDRRINFSST